MAVDAAYVSVAEYKARAQITSSANDTTMASDLLAVSRLVEESLGQYFNKDDAAVARVFQAKWSDRLDLDSEGNCPGLATSVGLIIKVDTDGDSLFTDETAWAATDYLLYPLQAQQGPEAQPFDHIRRARNGTRSFVPGGLVQVTGVFGWGAVPEMIKNLTVLWTKIWRLEGPEGTGRINELGAVVNMSLDVKRLMDRAVSAYSAKVTF